MLNKESFLDHLEALRQTILKELVVFALLLVPAAVLVHWSLPLLIAHVSDWVPGCKFYYLSPLEPFFIELKLTLAAAALLGLPAHLLLWGKFLAPALYSHEKKLLAGFLSAAGALFLAGGAMALTAVLPMLLRFSAGFATEEWQPMLTFNSLLSLALMLVLGFGLIFQLPVVILLLVRGGLIQTAFLRKHRAAVLIVILTLSAVLTPPDVVSQCLMAIPGYLFFEISLLLASRLEKKRNVQKDPEVDRSGDPPPPAPAGPAETAAPPPPEETAIPAFSEEDAIPSVYTRHRRGIRQGRPRRYRRD